MLQICNYIICHTSITISYPTALLLPVTDSPPILCFVVYYTIHILGILVKTGYLKNQPFVIHCTRFHELNHKQI